MSTNYNSEKTESGETTAESENDEGDGLNDKTDLNTVFNSNTKSVRFDNGNAVNVVDGEELPDNVLPDLSVSHFNDVTQNIQNTERVNNKKIRQPQYVEWKAEQNVMQFDRNRDNPGKLNLDRIAEYEDGPKCPKWCPFVSYEFKWHQSFKLACIMTITFLNFYSYIIMNTNPIIGIIMLMIMAIICSGHGRYVYQVWHREHMDELKWNLNYIMLNTVDIALIFLFTTINLSLIILNKLEAEVIDQVIPSFNKTEYAVFMSLIVFVVVITTQIFYSIWMHIQLLTKD